MIDEIENYISNYPLATQKALRLVHSTIQKAAPDANLKMSYGLPTFYLNGNLVHYAGYEKHIGFYPRPSAILQFENDLKEYKTAKGSIQFLLSQELPVELIARIVQFRVKENPLK